MEGTIARLVPDQGFGFIAGENGEEFFFHRTALKLTNFEELSPGLPVNFQVDRDAPGDEPGEHARAVNVRLAGAGVPTEESAALPAEERD